MSSNKKGVLYVHQGWTDIINSLPLVTWYSTRYEHLYILHKDEATDLIEYYTRQYGSQITSIRVPLGGLNKGNPETLLRTIDIEPSEVDLLYHGDHDQYRRDKYKLVYCIERPFGQQPYEKLFYVLYDIPYSVRVSHFNLERDYELEDKKYREFIQKYGETYSLYHEVKSDIQEPPDHPLISLANESTRFFDMIKVLEHAQEIHVLDSVWSTVIYLLRAKYGLFDSIPISVYCKRGFSSYVVEPIAMPNIMLIT
jgi:hypothetical protein